MHKFYLLFISVFYYSFIQGQPLPVKEIKWAWVNGENTENSSGNYGMQDVKSKNNQPVARSFPAGWTDKDGNLWMFGGIYDKELFLNDVWEYIPSEDIWVWVDGDNMPDQPGVYAEKGFSSKNKPGARRGALSWTDAFGNFWLFGGYGVDKYGNKGRLNDLWQYVPRKGWIWWSGDDVADKYGRYGGFRKPGIENCPGAREGAIGWTDEAGDLWLFGGEGYGEDGVGLLNDLWKFNTQTYRWQWMSGAKIVNASGRYTQKKIISEKNMPGARKYPTAWTDANGTMWFLGGYGYTFEKDGYLNDMWTFDRKSLQWTWMGGESSLNIPGNYYVLGNASYKSYPGARSGGVNWYDASGELWIFGGIGVDSRGQISVLNDMWKFDPEKDIWMWVSGSDQILQPGAYGQKGIADVDNTPGARCLSVGWLGKKNERWLFGGAGFATKQGGYLNDLWGVGIAPAPALSCPGSVVTENDNINCAVKVNNIDAVAPQGVKTIFELSGATTASGKGSASGLMFNPGKTTVMYSLADHPQQSCSFTVTVQDHTKPVPVLKQLPDITGECSVKINTIPIAIDNCAREIKGTTKDPVSYTKEGEYSITWSYDDGYGNVSTQEQKVMLKPGSDNLTPLITNLPDIMGECSATITDIPQASKNCGGFISGKTDDPLTYTTQGEYTINWWYDDGNGHRAKQTQKIIVKDKTAPKVLVSDLPDITGKCSITISTIPLAIDNCSGEIKGVTQDPLSYTNEGKYTITWYYNDGNGNVSTQTQKVMVETGGETLSPVVANLPDVTGECSATVTEVPQASKNCGGFIKGKTKYPLTYSQQGNYTIIWTYDDGNGHTAEQPQRIIVKDSKAPVPVTETLDDIIGECSIKVNNIPTAKDNCSGEIKATTRDAVSYTKAGEYTISWIYDDGNGNTSTQQQKVILTSGSDQLTPLITNLPDVTGECSATVTEVPQASKNCGGFTNGKTKDPLTYTTQGEYSITWTYDDGNGHKTQQRQKVIVKDGTAPVPLINALPDIIGECSIKVNDIPVAKDNCSGEIKATTRDAVSYTKAGEYTISWIYDDGNGNTSTQQQKVILTSGSDQLTPLMRSLPDITGECSATVTEVPRAAKNCGGFVNGVTRESLTYNNQGEYMITWTFDDGSGNGLQQTQRIIVKDTKTPVPVLQNLPDIAGECAVTVDDVPVAVDNCAGRINAKTKDALTYNKRGEYNITWIYDDANGNTSTQQQKIIVRSSPGALTPLVPELPDITGNCAVAVLFKPLAKDKCLGTIIASTSDPLSYKEPGTYTVHWKFSGSSDTIIQQQTVIVKNLDVDVKVYPNPANNYFTVSFKTCKMDERVRFTVFDVLGRAIETNTVNVNRAVILGTNYPTGTYFMQLKRGEETMVKKLIKLK